MDIFSSLNKEQKLAASIINGPVCVIAGAGSGKTKVLTSRIAFLLENHIPAYQILAITFTNKAAKEMKSRIKKIVGDEKAEMMTISTFHSFCSKIIRTEIDNIPYLKKHFTILDDDDQLAVIKDCINILNIDDEKFSPKSFLHFISSAKNTLKTYKNFDYNLDNNKFYIDVYRLYQERLEQNNSCDFDDLLFYVVNLFKTHPDVLARLQNKFKYISVDEYQDTNLAQYELTKLLSSKYRNIFVVGDIDQSIYGFRNSDYRNILNFKKDFPDTKEIKLEQNYRSTKTILDAANEVISHNTHRIDKNLWTSNNVESPIIAVETYTDKYEAEWVVNQIKREHLYNNRKYKDMSILIRTNSQSRVFEDFFVKEAIPYTIVGAKKFFDRKEIKDVMAFLKVLYNPKDIISLSRIINVPKRAIGDTAFSRFSAFCAQNDYSFFQAVDNLIKTDNIKIMFSEKAKKGLLNLYDSFNKFLTSNETLSFKIKNFLDDIGYFEDLHKQLNKVEINKIREENIFSLLDIANSFRNKLEERTLENFLEHVSLISDVDTMKDKEDKVTIMTCHASKGLEFPVVFLVGFEENIFPCWQSIEQENLGYNGGIEEERRLCYVAITRAKEQLYISWAVQRQTFNTIKMNLRSRFYDEIPEYLINEQNYN